MCFLVTRAQVKSCPDLVCYLCKQQGHFAKECSGSKASPRPGPAPRPPVTFPAQPALPPAPAYPAPAYAPAPQVSGYAQYYPPPVTAAAPPAPQISAPPPTHYQAAPAPSYPGEGKPAHYSEALASLQPLQAYMSTRLQADGSGTYPPSYIDLLATNVGKMFALANLSLPALEATFFAHGEAFLRSRISRELSVYAQQFPKGVNMPLVTEATVAFLKTQGGRPSQFSY